jgi:hypothetical protein
MILIMIVIVIITAEQVSVIWLKFIKIIRNIV